MLATLPALAVIPLTAPPLPERIALADMIVVGKVTSMDAEPVDALPVMPIPGVANLVTYRIANVSVDRPLLGARTVTRVRVGYVPLADNHKPARFDLKALACEQAGCFFLRKHPHEPFYVVSYSYDVIGSSDAKAYNRELTELARCVRLLTDVQAGLRAKESNDRLLTAALLIYRYRTPRHVYRGKPSTESIDAEESKQILSALAEADWNVKDSSAWLTPLSLFLRLGLTEEDSWRPPAKLPDVAPAAQRWLRDHAATYRIQRYVPPK